MNPITTKTKTLLIKINRCEGLNNLSVKFVRLTFAIRDRIFTFIIFYFLNCLDAVALPFDSLDKPRSPNMIAATPLTNIHNDLSVAVPVKNRDRSELVESYAVMPKIRRSIPQTTTAIRMALFIVFPLSLSPCRKR